MLAFPVMDFIANPQQFQEWRGRSLALTDPELFDRAGYMPVSRSLSAGKRHILASYVRYLEGALADLADPQGGGTGEPFVRPDSPPRPASPGPPPGITAGQLGHGD